MLFIRQHLMSRVRSLKLTTRLIEFQDPNRIRRVFVRVCACLDKIISLKAEWL